jgi:hypothetical protein
MQTRFMLSLSVQAEPACTMTDEVDNQMKVD